MTNGMCLRIKAFALSGRWDVISYYPGRCPGLWDCWAFSPPLLRSVSGVGLSARALCDYWAFSPIRECVSTP